MTEESVVFGIDVGGTHVRLGAVRGHQVIGTIKESVPRDRGPEAMTRLLTALTERGAAEWGRPQAVGVGVPGIVDPHRGTVLKSPHYPAWTAYGLRDALLTALDCPVVVDNDANVIAVGEQTHGAARPLKNFVMLTLGTGIGGAIVIDGQLYHGDRGFAAEIGHHVIDINGPACACGGHGCWELFASASGWHRLIDMTDDPLRATFLAHCKGESTSVSPEATYHLAQDGDIYASLIWKRFGRYVGAGIASLANILGIHTMVLGGGMTAAWDFFIEPTRQSIARHTYPDIAALTELHRAALGDHGGILGAAQLARAGTREDMHAMLV